MTGFLPLIAGNWKMNGSRAGIAAFATDVRGAGAQAAGKAELLVCPPAPLISLLVEALDGSAGVGGQDCHFRDQGAHTGDVSAAQLAELGCRYVIVGHSERRSDHGEADGLVAAKAAAAHRAALTAIICVGESLAERSGGVALTVVEQQLTGSLPASTAPMNIVIAYEPIWAIGSGATPTLEEIAEVHRHIHMCLDARGAGFDAVRVLYGGSVKPANAREILGIPGVDGVLVGGASLAAADFLAIAESCP